MTISFTIPGEPQGKGRPRFIRSTGRTYTPEKTASYENLVKMEFMQAAQGRRFKDDTAVGMRLFIFYPIPKSVSNGKRVDMLTDILFPLKKPDVDNVLKAVADSLNHIAYKDDSQITDVEIRKRYSDNPRVEVMMWGD